MIGTSKLRWGGGFKGGMFAHVISLENLFVAWNEFKKGKTGKAEVQEFAFNLEDNIFKLRRYIKKITRNHSRSAFALKCDVRKFFDNIDHGILFGLIKKRVADSDALSLIGMILKSFEIKPGIGLPLGNVTSQLFANVYLNELDQFIKHNLRARYYLRYCDDFIILDADSSILRNHIRRIESFLHESLRLNLHPHKIVIRKCSQGIDFLGYVVLPKHIALRVKTRKRILKKVELLHTMTVKNMITPESSDHAVQSYLGILAHCDGYKIEKEIRRIIPPLPSPVLHKSTKSI